MNYLLDTNVVSELRKAGDGKANPNVIAWFEDKDASLFYVSVLTLMELEAGVLKAERKDVAKGALLRVWLDEQVIPGFRHRTLPIDSAIALRSAHMACLNQHPWDSLIAATAIEHGMVVVTRNVKDFKMTGVAALDPWKPAYGNES